MKTFRSLFADYLEGNPSHLNRTELETIRKCATTFNIVEHDIYNQIPSEIIRVIENSLGSDLSRTQCAFIIRELDRFYEKEIGEGKVIRPKLSQSEAIRFSLKDWRVYKDNNIRAVALSKDEMKIQSIGDAILRTIIEKERTVSEGRAYQLHLTASRMDSLYNATVNEVNRLDIETVLASCPKSYKRNMILLLEIAHLKHLVGRESSNER